MSDVFRARVSVRAVPMQIEVALVGRKPDSQFARNMNGVPLRILALELHEGGHAAEADALDTDLPDTAA